MWTISEFSSWHNSGIKIDGSTKGHTPCIKTISNKRGQVTCPIEWIDNDSANISICYIKKFSLEGMDNEFIWTYTRGRVCSVTGVSFWKLVLLKSANIEHQINEMTHKYNVFNTQLIIQLWSSKLSS